MGQVYLIGIFFRLMHPTHFSYGLAEASFSRDIPWERPSGMKYLA